MSTPQSIIDRLAAARAEDWNDTRLAEEAVALARDLLVAANANRRLLERLQSRRLAAMMEDTPGKVFTIAMADQIFRPVTPERQARRFRDLVAGYGVPSYLSLPEQLALKAGAVASRVVPELVMPQVGHQLRRESRAVILPAEPDALRHHIHRRREMGIRLNFNQLGEAILGEGEAEKRLQANLDRLADPDAQYISVKFSAVFSQIHPVAFRETVEKLKHRLRRLYRAAQEHRTPDGRGKFVNLDMEEYRDLHLTATAFQEVLEEPEFHQLEAGIVLQAYLPDSWPVQKALNAWAKHRVATGGAGIKIRLVKGANLAMERVDAEIHGWPLAPYGDKSEVDANYKRMVHEGCRPENAAAVRIGIASHNLFDVAYGFLLRAREGVEDRVDFEMLEGMANHQARIVHEAAGDLLLYAPVVREEDFHSAIAYLIRRLDENTEPQNFLHDLFGMEPGDAAWERQRERFLRACRDKDGTRCGPSRHQDRATEKTRAEDPSAPFRNMPDTDFSLPANRDWIRAKVEALRAADPPRVPLQIGGATENGSTEATTDDPSVPGVIACRHALAGACEVERALACAVEARRAWRERGISGRAELLVRAAAAMEKTRGEAIAAMVREGGKAVMQADVEVSEAVDYANFYARSLRNPDFFDGSEFEPFGTVLVTPPWNFPYAIPAGGILAALAAGCTVIFKPAPETVLVGWTLACALWEAGIPREVMQFVPAPDDEIGRTLVTDSRVDAVILTGAYATGRLFLSWKPELPLFAETSGKNSLIITAAADPDLAVKDLVTSAFGHAGQKCSAASLGILEAEVYENPAFLQQLKDAAASLKVGPAWEYDSVVTPVINEPGEALKRALTTLEPGEEWLLEPKMLGGNPRLWSPGIKLGVKPGSWYQRTECFGPVLGLLRADNLEHAIRIQNDSDFGLTGGIHSLDPEEIAQWRDRVEVGNAYINRGITGAIVRRQPFGGWKHSCFGPGAKAGGPNYAAQLGTWKNSGAPSKGSRPGPRATSLLAEIGDPSLEPAAASDAWWMEHEFGVEHDPSGLHCEGNNFRYRPFGSILLRAADPCDLARIALAAVATSPDVTVEVSCDPSWEIPEWTAGFLTRRETARELGTRLKTGEYGLIRCTGEKNLIGPAAMDAGIRVIDHQPVANGRIELIPYFREQIVSETRHRHGTVLPVPSELP